MAGLSCGYRGLLTNGQPASVQRGSSLHRGCGLRLARDPGMHGASEVDISEGPNPQQDRTLVLRGARGLVAGRSGRHATLRWGAKAAPPRRRQFVSQEVEDEAHVSAEQPQAQTQARLPCPDAYPSRAGDHQAAPCEGPEAPYRMRLGLARCGRTTVAGERSESPVAVSLLAHGPSGGPSGKVRAREGAPARASVGSHPHFSPQISSRGASGRSAGLPLASRRAVCARAQAAVWWPGTPRTAPSSA